MDRPGTARGLERKTYRSAGARENVPTSAGPYSECERNVNILQEEFWSASPSGVATLRVATITDRKKGPPISR